MLLLQTLSVSIFKLTVLNDILFGIPEAIGSAISNAISTLIGKGLYYVIVKGLLKLINICYQFFAMFAGLKKVEYDGSSTDLLSIFFENSVISNIYWAMALVGIAMVFGFAIFSVVRKTFDIDDKQRASMGTILRNCFKSIITILLLSLCISGVINGTNVLMQTFTYIFDNAELLGSPVYIEFTEDQYSTMARILNTVGNYSLSTSRESRYNINSCFNEIRGDLAKLSAQEVFDGYYAKTDETGKTVCNWLTVLQELAHCADLNEDLSLDVYYENVSYAVINAMDTIKKNPDIYALENYTWEYDLIESPTDCIIDRVVFLAGTAGATNSIMNKSMSFYDSVRAPFYNGEKSIYDLNEVSKSFSIKLGGLDYILIAVLGYFILKALIKSILQCASRIFVMISLYLVAPPIIATMPWDDGEKFKQWVQAFLIQSLGVFGTIVPMRIMITLIPIVMSDNLVLFANDTALNTIGKVLLLIAALVAIDSFSQLLIGILGNNAGMASMRAHENAAGVGGQLAEKSLAVAKGTAALGLKVGFGTLGLMGKGIKYGYDKHKEKKNKKEQQEANANALAAVGAANSINQKKGANVNTKKDTVNQNNENQNNENVDDEIQSRLGTNKNSQNNKKDKKPPDNNQQPNNKEGTNNNPDNKNQGKNNGGDNADSDQSANSWLNHAAQNNNSDNNQNGNNNPNRQEDNASQNNNAQPDNNQSQDVERTNALRGAGIDTESDSDDSSARRHANGMGDMNNRGTAALGESASNKPENDNDNNGDSQPPENEKVDAKVGTGINVAPDQGAEQNEQKNEQKNEPPKKKYVNRQFGNSKKTVKMEVVDKDPLSDD